MAISGFILPSTLMMIVLAILYRHLRYLPDTERLFHGLNAAVVALIIVTAWRMSKNTLRHRWQWVVGVLACVTVVAVGATVIEVVLAAGLFGVFVDSFAEKPLRVWRRMRTASSRRRRRIVSRISSARRRDADGNKQSIGAYLLRTLIAERSLQEVDEDESNEIDETKVVSSATKERMLLAAPLGIAMPLLVKVGLLLTLSAVFLRIGSITFGGGFVMIPLIEAEVVNNHHWLTHQEFTDATALGQITPGPVLVTATFIGYRVAGTLGALVATVSIFLPSFLMTIAAGSSLRRFRDNQIVQSFLRGVTPAVAGLLVAAAITFGRAGIHTWIGLVLALCGGVVLVRFRPNPFWVILGAGVLRFLLGMFLW